MNHLSTKGLCIRTALLAIPTPAVPERGYAGFPRPVRLRPSWNGGLRGTIILEPLGSGIVRLINVDCDFVRQLDAVVSGRI